MDNSCNKSNCNKNDETVECLWQQVKKIDLIAVYSAKF